MGRRQHLPENLSSSYIFAPPSDKDLTISPLPNWAWAWAATKADPEGLILLCLEEFERRAVPEVRTSRVFCI